MPDFSNGYDSPSLLGRSGSPTPFTPENTFQHDHFNVPDVSRMNIAESTQSAPVMSDYQPLQVDPMIRSAGPMNYHTPYQSDMYFSHHSNYPLQYHLYAPSSASNDTLASHQRRPEDFFISNSLREELQRKNEATLQTLPGSNLPEFVHVYHSLVPIDTNLEKSTQAFGYPTWAYKACSNKDGRFYCLRRIEGYRLANEKAISIVQVWHTVISANVVGLVEAFTTRAFGDNSLVFVYEYFPLSKTLQEVHFGLESFQRMNRLTPEKLIWNYVSQLLNALKTIHGAGLAAKTLEPSRVLVTGESRIQLNCCGIHDVLQYESTSAHTIELQQREDILNLGKLILMLTNNSQAAVNDEAKAIEHIEKFYSRGLVDLVHTIFQATSLNHQTSDGPTLGHLIQLSSEHILESFNESLEHGSYLEAELGKELENGRIVRLLCKLGFINDRPEYEHDPAWSETGERYPLQLFRDFLFHQETDAGRPSVDLGHILRHLNKLDAGIDESIMLVSRDEKKCLVITYKELKTCIENAFRDLRRIS